MVIAINAAAQGERRAMIRWLVATVALGCVFLGVKGLEYYLDFQDKVVPAVNYLPKPGEGRAGELFWVFYWVATGLHAIHLSVGIGLVLYVLLLKIPQRRDHAGVLHSAGGHRHLLELRRYRMALSLP